MKHTKKTEANHISAKYSDIFVVNSARVSFSKESSYDKDGNLSPEDTKLINYLAKHDHWTPFSHIRATFLFSDIDMDWALTILTPNNFCGMVINKVMYNNKCYWAIRHSFYGWIKLLALNITEHLFQPSQAAFVYKTLKELYPVSTSTYSTIYDFSKYENNNDISDTHYVDNILEKNNNDYVYKLFNTELVEHFVDITIREIVPIFVARQRFKHMVGFTFNESSRRYVDFEPKYFLPDVLRGRAKNKKQGSIDGPCFNEESAKSIFKKVLETANSAYLELLGDLYFVCPEQARAILPQSMMTDYYATGSYSAWKRLEYLRLDPHSQVEIQEHAKEISEITKLYMNDINGYKENCTISIEFE